MRHGLLSMGHNTEVPDVSPKAKNSRLEDFVLEKSIFNNIFEKDIRRVFMYKKAERLAKAIHLIAPAFNESESLQKRLDAIAVGLVDAAILPPGAARVALSRELLTLSSILAIARTSGLLSSMNADLITREAHFLLQEVAAYEEPRLTMDEAPTLSGIAKSALKQELRHETVPTRRSPMQAAVTKATHPPRKGHVKDITHEAEDHIKDRREAILSVIRHKETASIKDVSSIVRGVSEKTVQRELSALVEQGIVVKQGERRWSTYSLR